MININCKITLYRCVNETWHLLATDSTLAAISIDQLVNILSNEPLFEESMKYNNGKVVSVQALAVSNLIFDPLAIANINVIKNYLVSLRR